MQWWEGNMRRKREVTDSSACTVRTRAQRAASRNLCVGNELYLGLLRKLVIAQDDSICGGAYLDFSGRRFASMRSHSDDTCTSSCMLASGCSENDRHGKCFVLVAIYREARLRKIHQRSANRRYMDVSGFVAPVAWSKFELL